MWLQCRAIYVGVGLKKDARGLPQLFELSLTTGPDPLQADLIADAATKFVISSDHYLVECRIGASLRRAHVVI